MDGFACSSILMIEPSGRWACRHAQSGVDPENQKIRTREALESLRCPARQVGVSLSSLESIRSDVDVRSPPPFASPLFLALPYSVTHGQRSSICPTPPSPPPPTQALVDSDRSAANLGGRGKGGWGAGGTEGHGGGGRGVGVVGVSKKWCETNPSKEQRVGWGGGGGFRWDIGRAREQRFRPSPMYTRPDIAPDIHELV